jgi:type III pantothenate kinase
MLLAIDVGNIQTVIGVYDHDGDLSVADGGLIGPWRLSTVRTRTEDELGLLIRGLLASADCPLSEIDGIVIASGVPVLTSTLRHMIKKNLDLEPVVVGPGVKTGLAIRYDNPREVGADRIANGAAVFDLYGGPSVVVDFGTATTLDVISGEAEYLGGSISPGVEISLEALVGKAAALSTVELSEPRSVIGKNTGESIRSGVLFGFAAQIDGLCARFEEEIGECTVVATGGLAGMIAPHTKVVDEVEPWLTLHGLRLIWQKNQ